MTKPGTQTLSGIFRNACLAELEALKPGNVHIFADGHGMVVEDFIKSAEAAAKVIAQPGISVGQRILAGVEATRAAVGCNTNLGIILLAAPLIQAALESGGNPLQPALQRVLDTLTVDDARLAYQAIRQASPAGLGGAERHDVRDVPSVSLMDAMQAAGGRDLIARQYANGYQEVFGFGLKRYRQSLARWERPAWAATSVYLGFLARFNDTHIERKSALPAATQVRAEAEVHEQAFMACANPRNYLPELLRFDASLKSRGFNPGTSADLTVASLMAFMVEDIAADV